jgi:hypothetical protein
VAAVINDIRLQGRWKVPDENFSTEIVIDAQGQATLYATKSPPPGMEVKESGYVWIDGTTAQIIFTKRADGHSLALDRLHCRIQSMDLMTCANINSKEKTPFFMTRKT